jgi:chemotaxis signal transduction protein
MQQQMVTFSVGEQMYCLPLLIVGQFCPVHTLSTVPGVDERIRGVTHLRGISTVVLDMRTVFRQNAGVAADRSDSILVLAESDLCPHAREQALKTYHEPVILEVDELGDILSLDQTAMHPTPAHLHEPFYRGVYDAEHYNIIALDFAEIIGALIQDIGRYTHV